MKPIKSLCIEFRWHMLAILILLTIRANVHGEEALDTAKATYQTKTEAIRTKADQDIAKAKADLDAAYQVAMKHAMERGDLTAANKIKAEMGGAPDTTSIVAPADDDANPIKAMAALLTPKNLKMIFKTPARFNAKTGMVSVAYDWSEPRQLADWDFGGDKPVYKNGGLAVPAASQFTMKAQWHGPVTLSGVVVLGNRTGTHLSTTTGLAIAASNYNAWNVNINGAATPSANACFSHDYTATSDGLPLQFEWAFTPTKTSLTWDKAELGAPLATPFNGQFVLSGATGGNIYRTIVIAGMLDWAWVKRQVSSAP